MIDPTFPMGMAVNDLIDAFSDHEADELVFHIQKDKEDLKLNLTFVIKLPEDNNLVQRHTLDIQKFKDTGEAHVAFDHIITQMHNELVEVSLKREEIDEDSNGRLDS